MLLKPDKRVKKKSPGISPGAFRLQTALELKETAFKLNKPVSELKTAVLKLNDSAYKLNKTALILKNGSLQPA